ncbi:MAG: hypothetical protein KHY76_09950 [Butyricicoccus pullicaecorum]|nr:hypothetical protein [Butyricicoccus pullicaecorum]
MNRNKQKTALIAALCAAVMVGMLVLSFILSSNLFQDNDTSVIQLPSQTENGGLPDDQTMDIAKENLRKIAQIVVDTDNVQAVIAALSRPDAYTLEVTNTLYWNGDSRDLRCRQYALRHAYRTETLDQQGVVQQVNLEYAGNFYAWDSGSSIYYSGRAGMLTSDETAMLPSYETVCKLAPEQIIEAALTEIDGQPMIRVLANEGTRTAVYVISTATGLLYRAEFSQGGKPTQTVQTKLIALSAEEELFFLPESTQLIFGNNP